MADSGGHWLTLAEAAKLTNSTKIPGVMEEDIKRVNPLDLLPVAQAAGTGTEISWLREKTVIENDVADVAVGGLLSWSSDMDYTAVTSQLYISYIQRKLDKYVQAVYQTYNNYRQIALLETEKALRRKLGSRILYGDNTYTSSLQMDGMHALAAEHGAPFTTSATTNDAKNIDNGEAGLSLHYLRVWLDAMLLGADLILSPYEIIRWLDSAYQEKGFAGLATATAGNLGFIQMGLNELGKRVLFWDGTPLVRTDYLVAEQANTGTGSSTDARALYSSGTRNYSMFAVKKGNVMDRQPGICFAYGGTEGQGDLYKFVDFPKLENYDAEGFRMVTYAGLLLGSTHGLGRIFDITDAAVTV